MTDYLSYKFIDSPEFMTGFDEVPLWSARFGFLLLDNLELSEGITLLDIGSGAGFPLIELAERLGATSRIYGIDPWVHANNRAKEKIKLYGLSNIEIIEQAADTIPFPANSVDLITSNLGINNFENASGVFQKCYQVLKPGGRLVITTNIMGHWSEFYTVFETTLKKIGKEHFIPLLKKEQEHRGTVELLVQQFNKNGFEVTKSIEDSFNMNFVNGTAFLTHHFVKCGWLESWFRLFPEEEKETIFKSLEENLNLYSIQHNGLVLTVPMVYIEGLKSK